MMIKLLEGEYPDYKPILNDEEMTPIEMDKTMFSTLMRRISILTSDDFNSVILNFKNNLFILRPLPIGLIICLRQISNNLKFKVNSPDQLS